MRVDLKLYRAYGLAGRTALAHTGFVLLVFLALLVGSSAVQGQTAPTVTSVAISSKAGPDQTYALGHHVRVTLTFSEAVNVSGTPQVSIDMDPADWGTKPAAYSSGSGSTQLTFAHQVVEPNISTQGVAVLADSLTLNGGSITSASAGAAAALSHAGLPHDPNHRVNWQATAPTVTGVAITSDPGDDDNYRKGDAIQVTLTFSEAVNVSGTPRVDIKMDPSYGVKRAWYSAGSGSTALTFAHTVVAPNISTRGVAVLANSLKLNGGTIRSVSSTTDVQRAHAGLAHDANHKVNWQASAPTVLAVAITSDPGDDDTYTKGDVIEVSVAFSEPVTVSGTPQIAIDMDPADWGTRWAAYQAGSGSNALTFAHTVVEPNLSTGGVAVLANTLKLNGGTIAAAGSGSAALLVHQGLTHDSAHQVDWQQAHACDPVAPSSVSALTIGQGAVVSWTLPSDMSDACEVTGFVVSAANEAAGLSLDATIPDPEARSHTMRGLTPGDYTFAVRVEYADGASEDLVTMEANNVPDACISLAVKPYAFNAVSGKITSVNGTGCVTRQMFSFEFKRSVDDYWYSYGRFPWSLISTQSDAGQPDFIAYDLLEPYVSYDFRIRAYDASDSEYTTSTQSITLNAQDPSATADANSPTGVRTLANNHGNMVVLWNAYTAPTGRTLVNLVVEYQPCPNARVATECAGFKSTETPDASETFHRLTNLTRDFYWSARVGAKTHLSSQPASTATTAWSVWTPAVRTWFEPTQIWFGTGPSGLLGRVWIEAQTNKNIDQNTVCNYEDDGESGEINCPPGSLVSPEAEGEVSIRASYTLDGAVVQSSDYEGDTAGPGAPQVAASGGNGKLVVAWHGASTSGIVGSLDAWFVEHRKQNADKTWAAWPTSGVQKAATDSSHTFTGLTNGTWQVRVQGRADGDDDDPMTTDTPILGFTSEIVTVTLAADQTDTAIPVHVTVTPGESESLIVEWEEPDSASPAYAYEVRHRESGTTAWTTSDELFPRSTRRMCSHNMCWNPRSYEIEDLTAGTRYEVQVRAKTANGWAMNQAGEAEWSHTRAARPND